MFTIMRPINVSHFSPALNGDLLAVLKDGGDCGGVDAEALAEHVS
jgi:hypothetical protein